VSNLLYQKLFFSLAVGVLLYGCGSTPSVRETPAAVSDLAGARRDVVMNAIAQIGRPYRYGGASPDRGFDCSGLVEYVFGRVGLRVPRDTRSQIAAAHSLTRRQLQPGDLVFFRTGRGQLHVGILVEQGRMVHAPSSGGAVEIVSVDSPYWARRFSGGGTLFGRI